MFILTIKRPTNPTGINTVSSARTMRSDRIGLVRIDRPRAVMITPWFKVRSRIRINIVRFHAWVTGLTKIGSSRAWKLRSCMTLSAKHMIVIDGRVRNHAIRIEIFPRIQDVIVVVDVIQTWSQVSYGHVTKQAILFCAVRSESGN